MMTITGAVWGNDDFTAAVVFTEERGAVAISEVDRPNEWALFQDWIAAGNSVAPLPAPNLENYTRQRSWEIRTGGTTVNGVPVKTDSDSIALINGMAMLAQLDPQRVFKFDTGQGVVDLDAATALAFATAIGSWIQATFDTRADALSRIASGEITTTEQVDQALAQE